MKLKWSIGTDRTYKSFSLLIQHVLINVYSVKILSTTQKAFLNEIQQEPMFCLSRNYLIQGSHLDSVWQCICAHLSMETI